MFGATSALARATSSLSLSAAAPRSTVFVPMGAVRHGGNLIKRMAKNRRRHKEKAWMYGERASDWEPETKSVRDWDVKYLDLVEVNTGSEEGKLGKVIEKQWARNKVIVEGVNLKLRQVMDMESNPFAPKFKEEGEPQPIHFRNVSLIDPVTNERVESVRWEHLDSGKWQRVCEKSGNVIPLPVKPSPPELDYAETLCTPGRDVLEVTYVPMPDYSTTLAKKRAKSEAYRTAKFGGAQAEASAPGSSSSSESETR